MAVATYEDVAVAIGRSISDPDEVQQVSQWLDDVEMLISARLGDVSLLDQALLLYVEREVVIARMRDRSEEDTDNRHYLLAIMDQWWDLLTPDNGSGAAFTITPYGVPGYSVEPDMWVSPTEQA